MIGFGSLLGFRGSDEHVYLTVDQISNGHFPSNHPAFPGHEWYGLSHFNKDKVHKLDSKTGYVREGLEDELGRFPVLSNGKEGDISRDFGGALKRLLQKLPKDHKTRRFYRRLSKDKKKIHRQPSWKKEDSGVIQIWFLSFRSFKSRKALASFIESSLYNNSCQ